MLFDLEELKRIITLATSLVLWRRLACEEAQVQEMLAGDDSLYELATKELKFIQKEKERLEKQVQDILDKDKEEEEFSNEVVLEIRAGAGGDEASLLRGSSRICMRNILKCRAGNGG